MYGLMSNMYSEVLCIFLCILPIVTQQTGQKWTDQDLDKFNICPSDTDGLLSCCYGFTRDQHGSCIVCPPGTFGDECETLCPGGTYGTLCRLTCGDNCSDCHPVYGCEGGIKKDTQKRNYFLSFSRNNCPRVWTVILVTASSTFLIFIATVLSLFCIYRLVTRKRFPYDRTDKTNIEVKEQNYFALTPTTRQRNEKKYSVIKHQEKPQGSTHLVRRAKPQNDISSRGEYHYIDDDFSTRSELRSSKENLKESAKTLPVTSSKNYSEKGTNDSENYVEPVVK